MFGAGSLAFHEFALNEPLPLATIQEAMMDFLRGREDVAVIGAQAVNAYVPESRMTQDVDLLSARASALADEVRAYLAGRFHIAVRVREVGAGRGFRVFQVRKAGNRHLLDVLPVDVLPEVRTVAGIQVVAPAVLVASKVIAYHARRGQPKSFTDRRDMAVLLLAFPDLKSDSGPVTEQLHAMGAAPEVLTTWREIAATDIQPESDEDEFA